MQHLVASDACKSVNETFSLYVSVSLCANSPRLSVVPNIIVRASKKGYDATHSENSFFSGLVRPSALRECAPYLFLRKLVSDNLFCAYRAITDGRLC